jgi:protein-S-isoprenylcysteine O-methyltransferase Ste14
MCLTGINRSSKDVAFRGRKPFMWKSIFKVVAATALFAGVHSLLASRAAKTTAVQILGERRRNALYRPFYNAQAVITFGALVVYAVRLPDREVYRAPLALARLMRAAQLASLLYTVDSVRQVGFLRFAGVPNLAAWLAGQPVVPREPEGQGPALDARGRMKATGPFRLSRHPPNFGMLPLLWLNPRMTVNLAAFNLITTIYLITGSLHEEKRLREAYGQAYVDYQRSGINFFVPSTKNLAGPESGRLLGPAS